MTIEAQSKADDALIGDLQSPGQPVHEQRCKNTGDQKPAQSQRNRATKFVGDANGNECRNRLRRQGRQTSGEVSIRRESQSLCSVMPGHHTDRFT